MEIRVEADKMQTLRRLAEGLSDKQLRVADTRAINVAIRKANTQYRREIRDQYNLTYADTKGIPVPTRATYSTLEGSLAGNTKPISLSRFNARFFGRYSVSSIKSKKGKLQQTGRAKAKRDGGKSGVEFEIHRGQKKRLPSAFMIDSNKGGLSMQVWARGKYSGNTFNWGRPRYPIEALKTVSPFGAMTREAIRDEIEVTAMDDMAKEFARQVELALNKIGARN